MSDEAAQEPVAAAAPAEQTPAAADPEPTPEPASEPPAEDNKKAVTFEKNELTFDEAQAEIDSIRARAGQARESLRTTSTPSSSSYGSYSSSSYSSGAVDDPKSKNMLSHLNSHSAMLGYRVQTARSLVRKQEDLLRNLARMRENMERSECELYKASDYYGSSRHRPYGYFERRAESAPFISRRSYQVRESSPLEITEQFASSSSDKAASPSPIPHVSVPATSTTTDYTPDEDFEKEMAALRRRVADLSKKANDIPTPRYSSYDYDTSSYSRGYGDIYGATEPKFEVKTTNIPSPRYRHVPKTSTITLHTSVTKPIAIPAATTACVYVEEPSYPRSSFTEYVMDSLNESEYPYPYSSSVVTNAYGDVYDPLLSGVGDIPLAY